MDGGWWGQHWVISERRQLEDEQFCAIVEGCGSSFTVSSNRNKPTLTTYDGTGVVFHFNESSAYTGAEVSTKKDGVDPTGTNGLN